MATVCLRTLVVNAGVLFVIKVEFITEHNDQHQTVLQHTNYPTEHSP